MTAPYLDRTEIAHVVKRVVAGASRPPADPGSVHDDEPLNGDRLKINSSSLVGLLVQVEDELGVTLADDLFVGRSFTTVRDLVDVVRHGCEAGA